MMRSPILIASCWLGLASVISEPAAAVDRPVPVEPVRACPREGPGFIMLPGTTTCVRIAGRVSAQATAASRRVSRDDIVGLGATGRVSLDARSDTPYGPVRGYVRMRAGQGSGPHD